ncbi:diphthine--ammonia ligase [Fibrobacterales bacterium]|nr:diphthine--ammonia ligase [Fibrobacterales bacterium]
MNLLCSWSGGKDSCYALMKAVEMGHTPKIILNMMNENGKISRSHAIDKSILEAQAKAMKLDFNGIPASWNDYEDKFVSALKSAKEKHNVEAAVFGDIDLQAHLDWEEKVCQAAELKPLLPLWQQDRKALVLEMIEAGIETRITSCNTDMGIDFLGRKIDSEIITELEALDIDVCGENGEFHTLVTYCPLFDAPIELPPHKKVLHENYCFLQWD